MRTPTDVLALVAEQIRDEMTKFEQDTVMGKAKDFSDYKFACGIYRGLMMTNGFIMDAVRSAEADEDANP